MHHFTDYLALGSPGDAQYIRRRAEHISKYFDAMSNACVALCDYYQMVTPRTEHSKDSGRLLPNSTYRMAPLPGLSFKDQVSFADSFY